jgi:hypothetical protein
MQVLKTPQMSVNDAFRVDSLERHYMESRISQFGACNIKLFTALIYGFSY